jgi:hypothetical protein
VRPFFSIAALSFGIAFATGALAQAGDVPSAAAKSEARERFDRGLRLFEKGENAGALAEFKRANELFPNPLVLYNMGLVYAAMNRPVQAVDALGAFLSQAQLSQRSQRQHAKQIHDEQASRIANLLVKTNVSATVDVDGIEVGQTPLAAPIRVASGAHVVGAQAPGYLTTRNEVTLPGLVTQTIELQLLPAASRMAQLWLSTVPQGAEIWVNGQSAGVTPLSTSIAVTPGTVNVEARRVGYTSAARTLTLGDGARGDVTLALQEDTATPATRKSLLRIVASEPGVEVFVDGVVRSNAGSGVLLPEGQHQLRVVLSGFEPYERTVTLPAGGEIPLAVILMPTTEMRASYESSVRTRKIVGWSLLGVGAAMAIGGAVYGITQLSDVSDARNYLAGINANEADRTNACYINQGPTYVLRGCDVIKADAQNQVDTAVLHRNLGFIGGGVGVLVAGVGTYYLLTAGDPNRYRKGADVALAHASFWLGDGSGGVSLGGHF